jgi:hypothetical protein
MVSGVLNRYFLQVWGCETGIARLTLQVPSPGKFAKSCIFSEDSSMILFGGDDKVVHAHDSATGHHISNFRTSACIIAIFSIAGKYAVFWVLNALLF